MQDNITRPIAFQQKYKGAFPTENSLRWVLWKDRQKLEAAGAVFKRNRTIFIVEDKFWEALGRDKGAA